MNRLPLGRFSLPPKKMRVPDVMLKSVGFLVSFTNADETEYDVEATGFFVGIPSKFRPAHKFLYFVTAKHVAVGLIKQNIGILVNRKGGGVKQLATNKTWIISETDASVDVAIAAVDGDDELDIVALSLNMFLTPDAMKAQEIGVGDEVFITGLLHFASGLGQPKGDHITPVVRTGNIAMLPQQRLFIKIGEVLHAAELYLVEARSIGGISGSPVFARKTIRLLVKDKAAGKDISAYALGDLFLLGLMHGHWDINESEMNTHNYGQDTEHGVNLGLATVVPAQKILDLLLQPNMVVARDKLDAQIGDALAGTADGSVE